MNLNKTGKLNLSKVFGIGLLALLLPLAVHADIIPQSDAAGQNSIPLTYGWNFISFPKQPSDPSMNAVLKDTSPNVRVIWGYDNQTKEWLKYRGQGWGIAGQKNLTAIEAGKGYWIYMDASGAIGMTNWTPPSSKPAVYLGWNLTGYNGTDGLSVADVLRPISGQWSIIWNWTAGTWYAKHSDPDMVLPVPSLSAFYQGKAYWLKMVKEPTSGSCGTWDSSLWDNAVWCQ